MSKKLNHLQIPKHKFSSSKVSKSPSAAYNKGKSYASGETPAFRNNLKIHEDKLCF